MRHRTLGVLAALGLAVVGTSALDAQARRAHFGARAGYDFDVEEFGVGAQLNLPVTRRLDIYPSFANYFVSAGSLWDVNADLKYNAPRAEWLYVGSGLNLSRRSVGSTHDTDAGVNVLVGAEARSGWIHPFADARLTYNGDSRVQLMGGLNITLGRRESASRVVPQR